MAQAQPAQLTPHVDHVLFGGLARVLSGLHGILLGRQPERVVTQGVQNVLARHPLVARIHIGGDEAQRMPDVQAGTGGVGEHVQDEELLAAGHTLRVSPRAGRVRGVERALVLPPVLPRQLDALGQLGRVSVRSVVHRRVLCSSSCGVHVSAGSPPGADHHQHLDEVARCERPPP